MLINFEAGLFNCGNNKDIYLKSLRKYFDRYSHSEKIDNLAILSVDEKYKFLHKMKGISSTLALEDISNLLKNFFINNLILNNNDIDSFNSILSKTLVEIDQICD